MSVRDESGANLSSCNMDFKEEDYDEMKNMCSDATEFIECGLEEMFSRCDKQYLLWDGREKAVAFIAFVKEHHDEILIRTTEREVVELFEEVQ